MYYYIIDNKIIDFQEELDESLYTYQKLTESQSAFYLANPNVSIDEILNEKINIVEITEEPS